MTLKAPSRAAYLDAERSSMDFWASFYDQSFDTKCHKYLHRRLVARLAADHLPPSLPPRKARLLDLGCGTGNMIPLLRDQGFRNITGRDVSPRMIEQARRKYPSLSWSVGPIEELRPKSERFDVVTAFSAIHHLQEPLEVAGILSDILEPGGILVLNEPDGRGLVSRSVLGHRLVALTVLPLVLFLRWKNGDIRRRNDWLNQSKDLLPEHHKALPDGFLAALEPLGFECCRVVRGHVLLTVLGPLLSWELAIDRAIAKLVAMVDVALARVVRSDDFTAVVRRRGGAAGQRVEVQNGGSS